MFLVIETGIGCFECACVRVEACVGCVCVCGVCVCVVRLSGVILIMHGINIKVISASCFISLHFKTSTFSLSVCLLDTFCSAKYHLLLMTPNVTL